MWWFRALSILLLLAPLPGCGFRPLYGATGRTAASQVDLGAITIDPIPDRLGQKVRQALVDGLTPRGEPSLGRYRLGVALGESQDGSGLRADLTYSRVNYKLVATWVLKDAKTDQVLTSGQARVLTAYNVAANQFATVSAELDARERAARDIAVEIQNRLAIYFESRGQVK